MKEAPRIWCAMWHVSRKTRWSIPLKMSLSYSNKKIVFLICYIYFWICDHSSSMIPLTKKGVLHQRCWTQSMPKCLTISQMSQGYHDSQKSTSSTTHIYSLKDVWIVMHNDDQMASICLHNLTHTGFYFVRTSQWDFRDD